MTDDKNPRLEDLPPEYGRMAFDLVGSLIRHLARAGTLDEDQIEMVFHGQLNEAGEMGDMATVRALEELQDRAMASVPRDPPARE